MRESRRRLVVAAALAAIAVAAARADGALELAPRTEPWREGERVAPAAREPGQLLALRAGARLGQVVLHERWFDFRGQPIAPGRYALVYALQPRLKEHVGADAVRDFALLVPAAFEDGQDAIAAARRVSGTPHPAVMALLPWVGEGDPPAELHEESPDRLVVFRTVASVTLGFVVLGRAPEPEL
jgi:hypothetical protein